MFHRIGHGVDVMNETNPEQLLREMAERNIMVEICLTSNAVILGVSGPQHPLSEYMRADVPVALATDDEGKYDGTLVIPSAVPLGDYDLYARTSGDSRCGRGAGP